jgi:hypothetical protein
VLVRAQCVDVLARDLSATEQCELYGLHDGNA